MPNAVKLKGVPTKVQSNPPNPDLKALQLMLKIRTLEKDLTALSQSGQLRGSLHLAAGQEACPVGLCSTLRKDDTITVTYRGHGYAIAKGVDFKAIVAEILGKEAGLCRGRGGKMHLVDQAHGLLGANGIVGAGIGPAAGAALAAKMDQSDRVSVAVFGDGTVNQGHSMEVFNMAGLWALPIIFFCENNLYAEMTPLSRSTAVTDLVQKMKAFGIAGEKVDGNDLDAVAGVSKKAVELARKGKGPYFIEAMTYRTVGHYQNDPGTSYRTREEIQKWAQRDPITLLAQKLKLNQKQLQDYEKEIGTEVQSVIQWALKLPNPSPADLEVGVFAS